MEDILKSYKDKKVLITGGLGFIGSSIATKLVDLGAQVTILDANLPLYGANPFNIEKIKNKIFLEYGDIRDIEVVKKNILEKDIIFNLAAQVDHNYSLKDPQLDIDINCKGHINVLEECRKNNPNCRVIFPGSRMQYGRVKKEELPVRENNKMNPLSVYAINKLAGELYYRLYYDQHKLDTVTLRVSNPYGPRAQVKHPGYCIVNWFIRQALEGKEIKVFGDGTQLRDYIFIEDLVDGFLIAGIHPNAKGKTYNLGSGVGTKFIDMTKKITEITNSGKVIKVPWPKNYESAETGDYYSDISKIHSELGWKPKISFHEGIEKTISFYKEHLEKYS